MQVQGFFAKGIYTNASATATARFADIPKNIFVQLQISYEHTLP
jgi:hypothetical protein